MIQYATPIGIGAPWVAAEVHAMQEKGIPCKVMALNKPADTWFESEWARKIHEETAAIYPLPPAFALSVLAAPFLFGRTFGACLLNALFGKRESFSRRVLALYHLFVACHWACSLRKEKPASVHVQWIHSAGTVGMYGAWLLGVPFSFTGHAVDLFRDRVALEDKIRRAEFIVCISNFHRQFYLDHGAREEQLITVHCGIDVDQFEFRPRDGLGDPPHIVSLGRLVEKKGFEYLIDACGVLRDEGVAVRCTIAGDGPLTNALQKRVRDQNLEAIVDVTGAPVLQEDLPAFMHGADIFAQPCVWSSDNDVDGVPRTLMEAMACGVPSVATRIAGLPDVVEDGECGLLVEPRDAASLAAAIRRVITEDGLAQRLSRSGRAKIERDFKLPDCLAPLERKFRGVLEGGGQGVRAADARPETAESAGRAR